jgi:hypothetical protein
MIGIDKRFPQPLREQTANGGLAGAHHADEYEISRACFHSRILIVPAEQTKMPPRGGIFGLVRISGH